MTTEITLHVSADNLALARIGQPWGHMPPSRTPGAIAGADRLLLLEVPGADADLEPGLRRPTGRWLLLGQGGMLLGFADIPDRSPTGREVGA